MDIDTVYLGDSLEVIKTFPDESIDCVVTSPPYYGLRDYGTGMWIGGDPKCDHEAARKKTRFDYGISDKQCSSKGTDKKEYENVCPLCGAIRVDRQIGLEETPEEYIAKLVSLFREIRRCLKKEGTVWVNLGDSYSGNCSRVSTGRAGLGDEREGVFTKGGGLPPKNLIGIPWRFAFAMQSDGWILRQDIIWHKPNPMPESVKDRCVKSHEYIFLFSKSERYFFDYEAIQEEANTQLDPRVGQRIEYDGKRKGEDGTGPRAFVALKTKPKFGGNKYGNNDDSHFQTYSGKEWQPRTKNCQYDGQRPNSFHLMREEGEEWQPKVRWGSGTKTERTHEQGYSAQENGGHRDNSGGFDCEMSIVDGVVVRNKRDVWTVNVKPNKEAHFATYPPMLIQPCILAGCPEKGIVLDPFMGSGTTGIVARKLARHFVGVELNPEYREMAERRISNEGINLFLDSE